MRAYVPCTQNLCVRAVLSHKSHLRQVVVGEQKAATEEELEEKPRTEEELKEHPPAATEEELEALLDHFHAKFAVQPISEPEVMNMRRYIAVCV